MNFTADDATQARRTISFTSPTRRTPHFLPQGGGRSELLHVIRAPWRPWAGRGLPVVLASPAAFARTDVYSRGIMTFVGVPSHRGFHHKHTIHALHSSPAFRSRCGDTRHRVPHTGTILSLLDSRLLSIDKASGFN